MCFVTLFGFACCHIGGLVHGCAGSLWMPVVDEDTWVLLQKLLGAYGTTNCGLQQGRMVTFIAKRHGGCVDAKWCAWIIDTCNCCRQGR